MQPAPSLQRADSDNGPCTAVRLLGADAEVPCSDGRHRRYVDLDHAASTSVLPEVWRAVEGFMPWCSSVHRGRRVRPQHDGGDQRPGRRAPRRDACAQHRGRAPREPPPLATARPPVPASPEPLFRGGGAVKLVTLDRVVWAGAPERHEAGAPNVVGVVALGTACRALGALGMDAVAEHERGSPPVDLRAGRQPPLPGAVRASIGLGTRPEDLHRLLHALGDIARHGPRDRYVYRPEHDEYEPDDPSSPLATFRPFDLGRRA